jgi:hypothetical protein
MPLTEAAYDKAMIRSPCVKRRQHLPALSLEPVLETARPMFDLAGIDQCLRVLK